MKIRRVLTERLDGAVLASELHFSRFLGILLLFRDFSESRKCIGNLEKCSSLDMYGWKYFTAKELNYLLLEGYLSAGTYIGVMFEIIEMSYHEITSFLPSSNRAIPFERGQIGNQK